MTKLLKLHLEPGMPIWVNASRLTTAIYCETARQTKLVFGLMPTAKDENGTHHVFVDESPEDIEAMMAS